jgi:hypothetical protein
MDTYRTGAMEQADKLKQGQLLAALGAWDRALRRDECGAWCINGWSGHIVTWSDDPAETAWLVYVTCRSARGWTEAKRRLSFCTVTQNGDDEGCLRLDRLPTSSEAEIIRDVLRIRKRVAFSEAELARRRQWARLHLEGVAAPMASQIIGCGDGESVPAVSSASDPSCENFEPYLAPRSVAAIEAGAG